jgi:putative glutamine amidotransferase
MQPRIAIPQAHSNLEYAQRVMPSYAHAVEMASGTPVEVPLALTNAEIMRLVMTCDGVLLPGSRADVNPEKYGQGRAAETHDADPVRDNVDELLLQDAYNMHKPILAICFGTQILNVWRTGTLVQHLATGVQHTGNSSLRHEVMLEPDSELASIIAGNVATDKGRTPVITVNTSHHQAVDTPGDGLRIVARSTKDGVVEAIEGTDPDHFVIAVQWHPERLVEDSDPAVRDASRAMFSALVTAAARWHEHPRTPMQVDFENCRS